ncbi:MAG: hypothetical protein AB7P09_17980 [Pyrinomonadaceae bacterium]
MKRHLSIVLGVALLINGFVVLSFYLSVSPIGTDLFMLIATFAILPILSAFLLIPLALIFLIWSRFRTTALTVLLGCVIYLSIGIPSITLAGAVRRSGFVQLAHRSRPLVSAIKEFESRYGEPPPTLESLVPEFLPAVPNTGMGAYPAYRYSLLKDGVAYEGNPWVLRVDTPTGALNWDAFLYLPKQNYPTVGYGGVLERIEDWAYIHE